MCYYKDTGFKLLFYLRNDVVIHTGTLLTPFIIISKIKSKLIKREHTAWSHIYDGRYLD